MVVKLIELKAAYGRYELQEIYLNPEHVVSIRPVNLKHDLAEVRLPEGLNPDAEFSKLFMNYGNNGTSVIVTGTPSMVEREITHKAKSLLKG